nr:MAG TPA: hypothetical protein [Caudoviricetes sp.]
MIRKLIETAPVPKCLKNMLYLYLTTTASFILKLTRKHTGGR